MKKVKIGLKIIIFLVLSIALFCGVTFLLHPIWTDSNKTTTFGFYDEPHNTVETIFLGASIVEYGIIPMELYENYGICSYGFGTARQPMMASYYYLEEAYRLNSESLDTIVLDVSRLKNETATGEADYISAVEQMKFSKVKYHFLRDFSADSTEFLSYLISITAFHERWKELTEEDLQKFNLDLKTYNRGYYLRTDYKIDTTDSYIDCSLPLYVPEEETEEETNPEDLAYLKKIIEFCNNKNLRLVLIKTPQLGSNPWSDSAHNTAQSLANQYQLEFYDFNYAPLIDEIDFNFATDSYDEIHLNYSGAMKLTDWLGQYLIEECGNRDIRGDENYNFMEEELADFHREIVSTTLADITDPAEYISYLMEREDYAIFISVKDDACDSLTEEQREKFESLGLTELSNLPSHASYLAVIEDGEIVTEQMQAQDKEFIDSASANGLSLYINDSGRLSDRTDYSIESGGYHMGNVSSIQIDGEEYSPDKRGLNIVVYDKELDLVVDQASFDTYASPERDKPYNEETLEETIQTDGVGALSGKLLQLYMYNRLCDDAKTAKVLKPDTSEDNLTVYLQGFLDDEEFSIYMSGDGDVAEALTNQERQILADMGLTELSEVEEGDSYLAVVQGDKIMTEQRGTNEERLQADGEFYKLCSGSTDEKSECSLIVQGTEYASETEGLNIVIYDNVLDQVVDSTVYDTDGKFVSVPD